MRLRIALAGELPENSHLFGKIDLLVGQISGYFCKDDADADVRVLVSPPYTGRAWMKWNETHKFPLCTYNTRDSFDEDILCVQTIRKDTSLRNLLGEAMCDKADALIVVWNEDVTELSGATWELMRIAYDRKAPCIWVSTKSQQIYCLWESYYKKYSPQYLSAMSEPLQREELKPVNLEEKKGRLMLFWEKCRRNYLKKHKADTAIYPSEDDYLLKQDFSMEEEVSGGETVRQVLLDKFHQFDGAAIDLNSRFQTMLYQRSVLPFIATIFLAIGFYVETLLGKTISGIAPGTESVATLLAGLLAGTGFLIHGCLNLYVYHISRSASVYRWQKEFVYDRYVAEILRLLIHFLPYGVELNLRKLCDKDRKMYMMIKHLTDDAEPAQYNIDHKTVLTILQHMKEMLGDQLSYHEFSRNRYKTIVHSLEKWGRRIFFFGFAMVLGRGALQFMLALFPIQEMNGMDMNGIVRSFLNMLALLLPAWAGYFTTKEQQNNFRYNLNNHENMLSRLHTMRERVVHALNQEQIPMEVFDILIEDFAEIMLVEDTIGWQQQYMNSSVKPL
ncbi:MAG: hypothetical protein J1F22_03110 [Lachnospiraceae bacterium]|nr:hypothetical protein [Lachnospiraceae bacterium]